MCNTNVLFNVVYVFSNAGKLKLSWINNTPEDTMPWQGWKYKICVVYHEWYTAKGVFAQATFSTHYRKHWQIHFEKVEKFPFKIVSLSNLKFVCKSALMEPF